MAVSLDTAMNIKTSSEYYTKIEKSLKYLSKNFNNNPSLKEIAKFSNLSEYHFQRLFTKWVGISPKRFMQFLSKERAREILLESESILDASNAMGFSSQSRLYDLLVSCEAVTPGEVKKHGEGLEIQYGIHHTPFGKCLLGLTDRGICHLSFLTINNENLIETFMARWKNANFIENKEQTTKIVNNIFNANDIRSKKPLQLLLRGTNFQIKVWEALLKIPIGYLTSYEKVANLIGNPRSTRAVANAVANNPIAYIIPCHRVIRKIGTMHNYRWGAERKIAMIGWEASKSGYQNILK